MNDIVYYLPSCETCRKILAALPQHQLELRDIKKNPLSEIEIDNLKSLAGNYESLFSRKSQLYKQYGLKDVNLSEVDFKKYLLAHYTFLRRPVFVIDNQIFIGNKGEIIAKVHEALKA